MSPDSHPKRYIFNDADLTKFLASSAKKDLVLFTSAMGRSCASTETSYKYDPQNPLTSLSPGLASLHGSLRLMSTWIKDFPPVDRSKARFGNPAFKQWHHRLKERSVSIVYSILTASRKSSYATNNNDNGEFDQSVLDAASQEGYHAAEVCKTINSIENEEDRDAVTELISYLQPSFGHEVRLDYGTGHECSFQVFLWSLCKLGYFSGCSCAKKDTETAVPEPSGGQIAQPSITQLKAATISIWTAYLKVTRELQVEYMLEPAGSHGVWGLDDYHCLPFYFGACEMQADGEDYLPDSIHDDAVLRRDGENLIYFGCIRFIKSLKKGVPFFESSPMLNDISNLPNWSKVAAGLLRLFEGEVLSKRQVVQHFVFGKVFAADWTPSENNPKEAPVETFRGGADATSLLGRAPWTQDSTTRAPWEQDTTSARAPWAQDMTGTRAPWAK